jgi:hypothetical protein
LAQWQAKHFQLCEMMFLSQKKDTGKVFTRSVEIFVLDEVCGSLNPRFQSMVAISQDRRSSVSWEKVKQPDSRGINISSQKK